MKNTLTIRLVRAGIIAALYFTLTVAFAPISFGAVQFRISEALCIIPLFFPECALGLIVGCFFSNLFGNGVLDLILGTSATIVASLLTVLCRKIRHKIPRLIFAEIPPILINAFIVPFTFLAATDTVGVYFFAVLTVGLGQLVVIATLGSMLYFALSKRGYSSESPKKLHSNDELT